MTTEKEILSKDERITVYSYRGWYYVDGLSDRTLVFTDYEEWDQFITVLKIADCKIKGAMLNANRD